MRNSSSRLYETDNHPDVVAKKISAVKALKRFINAFDVGGTVPGQKFFVKLHPKDCKTFKNQFKNPPKIEFFRKRPDASKCIRMHPNASQQVRMDPNGSEHVQTRLKTSKNLRKRRKKCKHVEKIRENVYKNVFSHRSI